MNSSNTVGIVVAIVVALVVIGLIVFLARKARNRKRAEEADRIRAEVHHESQRVDRQASLVTEAEAKARAAQAEAEAKAAEAARLADTAAGRRDALSTTQQDLDARREHADKLDPRVRGEADRTDRTGAERGDAQAVEHHPAQQYPEQPHTDQQYRETQQYPGEQQPGQTRPDLPTR